MTVITRLGSWGYLFPWVNLRLLAAQGVVGFPSSPHRLIPALPAPRQLAFWLMNWQKCSGYGHPSLNEYEDRHKQRLHVGLQCHNKFFITCLDRLTKEY